MPYFGPQPPPWAMPDPRFGNLPGPRDFFVSADGRVFLNPQDAIAASLGFEDASGTGAGCSQDPRNISLLPPYLRR